MSAFRKATKAQAKLRLALVAPTGGGKTFTALAIATALGGRIALIDTEHGSASKYADQFSFDVLELTSFAPERYIEAIKDSATSGYDVLIIDSASHAWAGKDGILEFVDKQAKRSNTGNAFGAWRDATPKHNALMEAIISAPLHVIVTMRSKMEYVQEKDPKTGRTTVRKVGMQPVQREGLEYEFDVVGDMNQDNDLIISKTRCPVLQGQIYNKPGAELAGILKAWLSDGTPIADPAKTAPATKSAPAQTETPEPAAKPTAAVISQSQRTRFWTIAQAHGWDEGSLRGWLATLKITSTKQITRAQYDDLCASLEAGPPDTTPVPPAVAEEEAVPF